MKTKVAKMSFIAGLFLAAMLTQGTQKSDIINYVIPVTQRQLHASCQSGKVEADKYIVNSRGQDYEAIFFYREKEEIAFAIEVKGFLWYDLDRDGHIDGRLVLTDDSLCHLLRKLE